jgi:hypothetical protein
MLTVPETAAPSAEGAITSVRWWAIATLARRRGRDLRGYAEVRVLSEPRLDLRRQSSRRTASASSRSS